MSGLGDMCPSGGWLGISNSASGCSDPWGNNYGNALMNGLRPGQWIPVEQNQLAALQNLGMHRQTLAQRAKQRRNTACQWFATKWRTRASEIGVQAAARLMRKQGIPCDVAVSLLATR